LIKHVNLEEFITNATVESEALWSWRIVERFQGGVVGSGGVQEWFEILFLGVVIHISWSFLVGYLSSPIGFP
jgi:hypothetical protein